MTMATMSAWGREPAPPVRARELFLLLCAAMIAVAFYSNEVVMTREVFHSVLGGQLDSARIDVQYDLMRRWSILGYVLAPLLLALEMGTLALTTQLCVLLAGADVSLAKLFRLALLAHFPLVAESAVRTFWLGSLPASAVTMGTLNMVPWSLANAVLEPSSAHTAGYAFASAVNPGEAAWGVIMAEGIVRSSGLSRPRSGLIVLGMWIAGELAMFIIRSFLTP
jgi:hypothetical protein